MAACINMAAAQRTYQNNIWAPTKTDLTMTQKYGRESRARNSSKPSIDNMNDYGNQSQNGSSALTVQETEHSVSSDETPAIGNLFVLPMTVSNSLPRLYKSKLAPLDLRFNMVSEEPSRVNLDQANKKAIRQVIVNTKKGHASVCFVVKRPGCVLCHEQGRALGQLLSEFRDNQVAGWAVVKEIDVDNDGLLTLYQQYFRFPFFRDTKLALYSALGDRKVGIVPNPVKILKRYRDIRKRLKEKGIEGNIIGKGEGMLLGGVFIFDRSGTIRYAHEEQFSRELPVDEIRAVLTRIIEEGNSKLGRTSVSSSSSELSE